MDNNETTVITGLVRFSYMHVFEKYQFEEGEPKYATCILIPKSDKDTLRKLNKAISAAIEAGLKDFGVKDEAAARKIRKFWIPLQDGDEEKDGQDGYENCMFINASSKTRRPGIVDKNVKPILDPEAFVSGDYGRADISFYPFSKAGNKGVGCSLNNVQKLKDGEPLGGANRKPEEAFGDGFTAGDDEDDDDMMG